MIHPLQEDLSKYTDNEIESKLLELTKKYFAAQRMGNLALLTQLSTFVTIYKEEMSMRYYRKTKTDLDKDLDNLINVD